MARVVPLLLLALVGAANARLQLPAATDVVMADEYIVVYRADASPAARSAHEARMTMAMGNGTDERFLFNYDMPTFKGYAAKLQPR